MKAYGQSAVAVGYGIGAERPVEGESVDVLTAFGILLYRYTGQDELVLEVARLSDPPVACRIALLVSGVSTFEQLRTSVLEQLARSIGGLYAAGHITESWVSVPDSIGRLLATHRQKNRSKDETDWLKMRLTTDEGKLTARLVHSEDSFDASMMTVMGSHLRAILEQGLSNPGLQVARMQLLSRPETHKLLVEWNNTDRPRSASGVADLITEQANKTPHACALICGERRLAFGELNDQVHRLARYLRSLGAGPGSLIGYCLDNSIGGIVAILALLKAGAAYVPLDPTHPPHRLKEIIRDANLQLIITDSAFRDLVAGESLSVLELDREAARIAQEPCTDFHSGSTPASLAYVVYTSGSTGQPNGVLGIHASILNGLHEVLFDISRDGEVCCLNGPLSVGFQLLGVFLPLLAGVPLVILSKAQFTDPILFADAIHRYGITSMAIPTPMLRQMLSVGERVTSKLGSMRVVMVGGAQVSSELVDQFRRQLPDRELYKGYGATEIGSIATKGYARPDNCVGRPIANTRVYVLDNDMNLVPPGACGEIYVAGSHLARGYLNRPDLTNARFLADPYVEHDGERMYRTGDLGRWLLNGEIELLGRRDDQVKIRGFRVQLGEVETMLAGHEHVQEVSVTVRDAGDDQQLVAYVVSRGGARIQSGLLREYLCERLPQYMIPAAFVFLDTLPMTASGKVDRKALPPPGPERPDLQSEYAGPQNAAEIILVEMWQRLLNVETIGVDDDFLELGGDSLFAVQVASEIWERMGVDIPVELIFQHPTVANLARFVMSERGAEVRE